MQQLESRRLLATDVLNLSANDGVAVQSSTATTFPDSQAIDSLAPSQSRRAYQPLSLPDNLPASFSVPIEHAGETLTLELAKTSVFGENTRFLVDDGSGSLTEVAHGPDRSYLGGVAEHPGYSVSAWLSQDGLMANVIRPGRPSITVEPVPNATDDPLHRISIDESMNDNPLAHDHDGDGVPDHAPEDHTDTTGGGHPPDCCCAGCLGMTVASTPTTAASVGPVITSPISESQSITSSATASASLPPSRVMDVYEFEVGVEIGSAALLNNYSGATVASKVSHAMSVAAGLPANLNARYLHATGIRYRLGTVIIRESAAEDPFTVAHGNDSAGLSAFRSYWNNNPQEVGTTHDMAVYHVRGAPSGLAYVNQVGTGSRYALSASNGPTSWADGTLVHEFGHTWSLGHVPGNPSSSFYESKPRSNGNAAGGNDVFVSIMHGGGSHNIGRLSTGEANQVYNVRQNKLQFGDLVTNPGEVKPFGHLDEAVATGNPIVIDVIANDYDVNNDVLNVQLRDTVSQQGGTISVSAGTGPGGRDELIYTPPVGAEGTDFFHYNVVDSTGRRDWGAVYVDNQGPVSVDLNRTEYFYDLGTPDSPLFNGNADPYERVSEQTFGDLGFTSQGPFPVESRDREANGQIGNVNDINRDHIRMKSPGEFTHALSDGVYDVVLTIGDAIEPTAPIRFTAENTTQLTTASHLPETFTSYRLRDILVTDGELNLGIENLGFSANITRIMIFRVGEAPSVVDLSQTRYVYDVGAADSVLFNGSATDTYVRLPHNVNGDIAFVGGNPQSFDRPGPGINAVHRDGVSVTNGTTLHHALSDGIWQVLINIGDRDVERDNINISAEGQSFATNVDRASGAFNPNIIFNVPVTDGTLNLELNDTGGINNEITVTRFIFTRIGDTDSTAPILNGITRYAPSEIVTAADSLVFRATFNEQVQNVNASDFDAMGTTGTITGVAAVQGTGESVYEITVSGGDLASLNGTVGVNLSASLDITDLAGNSLASTEPAIDETYLVDNVAPQVESVLINDGNSSSRSQITSLQVKFDRAVDHTLLQSAFVVTNIDTSTQVGSIDVAASDSGGKTTATLTFAGVSTVSRVGVDVLDDSLSDGNYRLDINSSSVRRADTNMTMLVDHVFGGQLSNNANNDDFYRLYGDANGDGRSNIDDFVAEFLPTFGSIDGENEFRSDLDHDGNGRVNLDDFVSGFLPNFGKQRQ